MAYGDCLPYAIAFQLMPEWGERFAGLRPPDTLAPGGLHLAPGSAGFLSGFTNAGLAAPSPRRSALTPRLPAPFRITAAQATVTAADSEAIADTAATAAATAKYPGRGPLAGRAAAWPASSGTARSSRRGTWFMAP